jgi:dihydroorotate dehydrogenase (fumarate)
MSLASTFTGLALRGPVLIASGPASHDVNQLKLAEDHGAGAVVLKTACSDRFAHMRRWPRPRYRLLEWDRQIAGRSKAFSLYSYEQGYSGSLDDYWAFIRAAKAGVGFPIIGSIFADQAEDWAAMAVEVERAGADALELDISSPHRPGSLGFETTFTAAIRAVVKAVRLPIWVKLAPGPDVVPQCVTAEQCGAAAVTLCNRMRGFDVDVEEQRPILHGNFGGIGGPWAKFYVLRHVAEAARAVSIPISATGGVMTGEDVLKYILVGAATVQILSVIMVNGWESVGRMNAEITEYMERKGISSLEQIRGLALTRMASPDAIVRWSGEPVEGPRNVWK